MSFTEVLLILAIALVILGPERLPGLARSLGRAMREFRKASREIRATLEVEEVRRSVRQRVSDELTGKVKPPETERTGVGSVAWKNGKDDLADKKKALEKARQERLKKQAVAHGDAKVEDEELKDNAEPTPELPTSNADLNENKLDLTSPATASEKPDESATEGTQDSPSKQPNGQ